MVFFDKTLEEVVYYVKNSGRLVAGIKQTAEQLPSLGFYG
jgi:hypothetical protein